MNTELCSNIIFFLIFPKTANFSELQKKPRAEFDLKKTSGHTAGRKISPTKIARNSP